MRPLSLHILPALLLFLSFPFFSYGQERCGTVDYTKQQYENPAFEQARFEQWISRKISTRSLFANGRQKSGPYKIPVVVHVIHNGEAIGQGANIPDAQILSQIRVLNDDFRRENSDAVNTPAVFQGVAGGLDIEFVLAKQDPEGQPTNGIVRVNGDRSSWTMSNNYTLKDLSYWPAEEYMNIWVCNLTSHLGYAQFPESDLPGLEESSTNPLTDGVVVWYRAFGSIDDGAFDLDPRFNKGRTTTHETGHFFGLNHIWGDDVGCTKSDYVDDTPNQADRTNGCPTHPKGDSCSEVIMFQNFLDYTDDACMNLFTQGQVARMSTVIENSPRRASLLNSPGLEEPAPVPNDLGIRGIVFPDASVCSNLVAPVIEVRNYGNNAVTSASIRFTLDGTSMEVKSFPLALDPFESTSVVFSAFTIPSGDHEIAFEILATNGGADGASYNNEKVSNAIVPAFGGLPFTEDFGTMPSGWIVDNPDGQVTWHHVDAANGTPGNKALILNYYEYEDKIGEIDVLLSPVFDFTNLPAATLTFDVAHARYQSSNDRLRVVVLTNCEPYTAGAVIYDKAGDALKTAPATSSPFAPVGQSQWRRELLDLSAFIGRDKVQLAFIGVNDWGNNLYLDNISVFTDETRDVRLARLVRPSLVTCEQTITPRLAIQNAGSILLDQVEVRYSLNGGPAQSAFFSGLNLPFGEQKEVDLPALTLGDGANGLLVALIDPTGEIDLNPQNNQGEFLIVVNEVTDRIPLRQDFEKPLAPAWTVVNPAAQPGWELINTNFGNSLFFSGSDGQAGPAREAWLVTPVLDFSRTNQASMLLDVAYNAGTVMGQNVLTILASTDCGSTYSEVAYTLPGPHTLNGSPPSSDADWHTDVTVGLNALAGKENVRLAFVVNSEHGMNVAIDNIEFFVSGDPSRVEFNGLYTLYGYDLANPQLSRLKISFNLPERQQVRYSVVSATGQMETDGIISDVLNQTFSLDLHGRLKPGVYFIRLGIGGKMYSSKVLVF